MANLSDAFNRADSTTSLGSADTGGAWTAQQGTWGILSNEGYLATSAGDGQCVATLDASSADGTLSAKLSFGNSPDFGLIFRFSDNNNYSVATNDVSFSATLVLYKRVAGSFTSLGSASNMATGGTLSVELSGGTGNITVKKNGVSAITSSDTAHGGTKYGLRVYGGASLTCGFDDFSFADAGGGGGPATVRNRLSLLGVN
jgi:hypothetical protein